MNENTLSSKLNRIDSAMLSIRNTTNTQEASVEEVVSEVGATVEKNAALEQLVSTIEPDVTLFDYDGTVLYTYLKDDFLKLETLPENPSHEDLTAKGWSWTLEDAKEYLQTNNKLDIGQIYDLENHSLKLKVKLIKGFLNPSMYFRIKGTVEINWGDGTTSTKTSSDASTNTIISHTYAEPGEYTIYVDCNASFTIPTIFSKYAIFSGKSGCSGPTAAGYARCIKEIYFGKNMGTLAGYGCSDFTNLEVCLLPSSCTEIPNYFFSECAALKAFVGPNINTLNWSSFIASGIEKISVPNTTLLKTYVFSGCPRLKHIALPKVTSIGAESFDICDSLEEISMPLLEEIPSAAFGDCRHLKSLDFPKVATIGDTAFQNCRNLKEVCFPLATSIGNSTFKDCRNLKRVDAPLLTSIGGQAFGDCHNLVEVPLENLTLLNSQSFWECHRLNALSFPNVTELKQNAFSQVSHITYLAFAKVESIANEAFRYMQSLTYIDFSEATTIPTLAKTTSITGIDKDCKIIVPDELYDEWIAAPYWSSFKSYIIKASTM